MTNPRRLQLKRTKGFDLQKASLAANGLLCVKVDRSTMWGNPFPIGVEFRWQCSDVPRLLVIDRNCSIAMHKLWLTTPRVKEQEEEWRQNYLRDLRNTLRGKNLACWCKESEPCHADVLLEISNP